MAYVKALHPSYSHYLESLQASGQLGTLTFDTLAENFVEREKAFGKKIVESPCETLCIAQKRKK